MLITEFLIDLERRGIVATSSIPTEFDSNELETSGIIQKVDQNHITIGITGRTWIGKKSTWQITPERLAERRQIMQISDRYTSQGYTLKELNGQIVILEQNNATLTLIVNTNRSSIRSLKRTLETLKPPIHIYHYEPHRLLALNSDKIQIKVFNHE
jgi:hypothetical protein